MGKTPSCPGTVGKTGTIFFFILFRRSLLRSPGRSRKRALRSDPLGRLGTWCVANGGAEITGAPKAGIRGGAPPATEN